MSRDLTTIDEAEECLKELKRICRRLDRFHRKLISPEARAIAGNIGASEISNCTLLKRLSPQAKLRCLQLLQAIEKKIWQLQGRQIIDAEVLHVA